MATYPGAVRSFTTKIDYTDTVFALHMNDAQDEITAIQNTLGTNPQGAATGPATVGKRIADLEGNRSLTTHTHSFGATTPVAVGVGTGAAIGASEQASRSDHAHQVTVGTPVATASTGNSAGVAASVPRSDHLHLGPGRRASQTSSFTNTTTNSGTLVQVATLGVTTLAGRWYRVSFSGLFITAAGGIALVCDIQEDGASLIGSNGQFFSGGAGTNYLYSTSVVAAITSPSAAAHTYTFKISALSGGGSSVTVAPFYFLVEDIG